MFEFKNSELQTNRPSPRRTESSQICYSNTGLLTRRVITSITRYDNSCAAVWCYPLRKGLGEILLHCFSKEVIVGGLCNGMEFLIHSFVERWNLFCVIAKAHVSVEWKRNLYSNMELAFVIWKRKLFFVVGYSMRQIEERWFTEGKEVERSLTTDFGKSLYIL